MTSALGDGGQLLRPAAVHGGRACCRSLWTLLAALSPNQDGSASTDLQWSNFSSAWTRGSLGQALLASTVITVGAVVLQVLLALGSGYAFGVLDVVGATGALPGGPARADALDRGVDHPAVLPVPRARADQLLARADHHPRGDGRAVRRLLDAGDVPRDPRLARRVRPDRRRRHVAGALGDPRPGLAPGDPHARPAQRHVDLERLLRRADHDLRPDASSRSRWRSARSRAASPPSSTPWPRPR